MYLLSDPSDAKACIYHISYQNPYKLTCFYNKELDPSTEGLKEVISVRRSKVAAVLRIKHQLITLETFLMEVNGVVLHRVLLFKKIDLVFDNTFSTKEGSPLILDHTVYGDDTIDKMELVCEFKYCIAWSKDKKYRNRIFFMKQLLQDYGRSPSSIMAFNEKNFHILVNFERLSSSIQKEVLFIEKMISIDVMEEVVSTGEKVYSVFFVAQLLLKEPSLDQSTTKLTKAVYSFRAFTDTNEPLSASGAQLVKLDELHLFNILLLPIANQDPDVVLDIH